MSVYIVALSWSSWHTRSQRARVSVHLRSPPRGSPARPRSIDRVRLWCGAHCWEHAIVEHKVPRTQISKAIRPFSHLAHFLIAEVFDCSLFSPVLFLSFSFLVFVFLFYSLIHFHTYSHIHVHTHTDVRTYTRDNHTHAYIHVHFFSHHHSCLLFFLLPSPSRYFKRQRGRVRLFARKSTVCI